MALKPGSKWNATKVAEDEDEDNPYKEDHPRLRLLTEQELDELPDGTVVWSIFYTKHIKGKEHLDKDTRFGYTSFAVWSFIGPYWSDRAPDEEVTVYEYEA